MRRLLPALLLAIIPNSSLLIPVAHATDYQQCSTSSTCTIGEFLYDDEYVPLTGATCTLTAKYPSGTTFLNGVAMTGSADGWYKYDATTDTTTGLYHASICCTAGSDYLCLDKSFEVNEESGSSLTAASIWNYSDRTLTGYGTLVSDIWNYSTRSLTSFGNLVSDIWGYSSRTMTSFGSLVTDIWGVDNRALSSATPLPSSLENILAEQKVQRELLEKIVNAPVISLSLEDGQSLPDLETKLEDSRKQASLLFDHISTAKSRLMVLDSKWDRLSDSAVASEITGIATIFQNSDPLIALTKSWDTPTVTGINAKIDTLKQDLGALLSSTTVNKTKVAPTPLISSLTTLDQLEQILGDTSNTSGDQTLFGYLASVADRHQTLKSENQKISAVLENLNGQGTKSTESEITQIKSRLLTLNQYPGGDSLANPAKSGSDPKLNFKNILYSLQALIGLNTQLLALNVGQPIRSLWLEEGSVIFRAVITNPSSVISQTVPLKFYLPREIKTEDIIEIDPSLTTTYDPKEEALYATGSYDLKPKETKLIYVEVEDIWLLTPDEIQTLRTQAESLLKPLEKTAYFSQGTTLKSDIDVTLDKVLLSTGKAITPENRIRTYREAKLELTKVTANMNRLQDLVAQSSGTGSVFGFVGGVQTVAVWGIILVVVAGFIFLSLYFKKLGIVPQEPRSPLPTPSPVSLESEPIPSWRMPAIISVVVIVTAVSTIYLTRLATKTPSVVNQVTPTLAPSPSPTMTPVPSTVQPASIDVKSEKSVLGETSANTSQSTLVVPDDSSVNLRNAPLATADIIMALKQTTDVYVFKTTGDWSQIGFSPSDVTKGYWVHSKFIEEK